jgi:hypothetical protein
MHFFRANICRGVVIAAIVAVVLTFSACENNTSSNAPAKPKTNELRTGRFALQKMIPAARLWSPDALPVNLSSSYTSDSNGHDGKAMNWRSMFASRSRQKAEPFMWTGSAEATTKIDHGVEDVYNPNNRSMQSWDLNFLKIDTDQAFETALQHGGKSILEKDPNAGVSYLLDFDPLSSQLRWHVTFNGSSGRLGVVVDASSGTFLRKE